MRKLGAEILNRLQSRLRGNLEEFYHGVDVFRAVVERCGRQEQHLVVLADLMKDGIVLDVLVAIDMSLVDDDKHRLVLSSDLLVFVQYAFHIATTINAGMYLELKGVVFPLLCKMGWADDKCSQVEIAGHSSSDDTLTQSNYIGNDSAIMTFDGVYGYPHGIGLILQIHEFAMRNLGWGKDVLVFVQLEILVKDTEIEKIGRRSLLVPDVLHHTFFEILDVVFVDDYRGRLPKRIEDAFGIVELVLRMKTYVDFLIGAKTAIREIA